MDGAAHGERPPAEWAPPPGNAQTGGGKWGGAKTEEGCIFLKDEAKRTKQITLRLPQPQGPAAQKLRGAGRARRCRAETSFSQHFRNSSSIPDNIIEVWKFPPTKKQQPTYRNTCQRIPNTNINFNCPLNWILFNM